MLIVKLIYKNGKEVIEEVDNYLELEEFIEFVGLHNLKDWKVIGREF